MLNLQEWMSMSTLGLTFLANIEVWADNTFVSDTNNWGSMAFVTSLHGNHQGVIPVFTHVAVYATKPSLEVSRFKHGSHFLLVAVLADGA